MSNKLMTVEITNSNDETYTVNAPMSWEICDTCEGEGKHSYGMGSFTMSEWEAEGEDFQRNYMAGRYDRRCGDCKGAGKVRVIDHDAFEAQSPEDYALWQKQEQEDEDFALLQYYERRMGA